MNRLSIKWSHAKVCDRCKDDIQPTIPPELIFNLTTEPLNEYVIEWTASQIRQKRTDMTRTDTQQPQAFMLHTKISVEHTEQCHRWDRLRGLSVIGCLYALCRNIYDYFNTYNKEYTMVVMAFSMRFTCVAASITYDYDEPQTLLFADFNLHDAAQKHWGHNWICVGHSSDGSVKMQMCDIAKLLVQPIGLAMRDRRHTKKNTVGEAINGNHRYTLE